MSFYKVPCRHLFFSSFLLVKLSNNQNSNAIFLCTLHLYNDLEGFIFPHHKSKWSIGMRKKYLTNIREHIICMWWRISYVINNYYWRKIIVFFKLQSSTYLQICKFFEQGMYIYVATKYELVIWEQFNCWRSFYPSLHYIKSIHFHPNKPNQK